MTTPNTTQALSSVNQAKPFRGLLTQLLHEAFYLEEEGFHLGDEDRAYVEEDESDQFEVIRHLLGSLTPS